MFLFWGLFLLLVLLTLAESLNRKLIPTPVAILLFLIFTLLIGFRPPEAVADYQIYLFFFQFFGRPADYFINYFTWALFEPMYYLIPSILHYTFELTDYVSISLWFYAVTGTGLVILALRKVSVFYYTSVLTLFCYYLLLHQFTQIRVAIAVALLLLAVYYRYWNNTKGVVACLVISLLFHYSSVLGVVLFFVPARVLNRKVWLALTILAFLFSFVNFNSILGLINIDIGALSGKKEAYIDNIADEALNRRSFFYMLMMLNTLVVIYYSHIIYQQNPYIYLLVKLQVVGLLCFQLFSSSPVLAARVSEYFLVSHLVCFPAVLHLFQRRFWPAVVYCTLMAGVLFFFLHINKLINLQYYAF